MRKHLLVSTVQDRLGMLKKMLATVRRFLPDWEVTAVCQEFTLDEFSLASSLADTALFVPLRVGPHNAKLVGLRDIANRSRGERFVVCSVDDDMEFIEATNFQPMVEKVMSDGVGFVSGGWVNAPSKLAKKPVVDEFVEQPIVYTGGGMLFSDRVAQLVCDIPPGNYFCDNTEWSLATYLAGYRNFRYKGSVAFHWICSRGGRRAWVQLAERKIPDPRFLRIKRGNRDKSINNWLVGASSDLTEEARALHKQNRAELEKGFKCTPTSPQ
jgi:hypothetical protein